MRKEAKGCKIYEQEFNPRIDQYIKSATDNCN